MGSCRGPEALTALVTVADVGSATKAAALLHLVQPAVTRQVRTLEDEFGVEFFQRTRQGMIPAAAAELWCNVPDACCRNSNAPAQIRPATDLITGTVTVGQLESAMEILLQPLAAIIRWRYSGVQLRVVTAYSGHLQEWLDAGDVDLSLLYGMAGTTSLIALPLPEESVWVVGGPDAGLTVDEPVTWRTLLVHPLVLPIAGHGLRALTDRARPANWGEPDIACETNPWTCRRSWS